MASRRSFIFIAGLFGVSGPLLLASCTQGRTPPEPFRTGQVTRPPDGCIELRSNDSRAFCG